MLFDLSGRITMDNIFMDDGEMILPGTMITNDGEFLWEFIDHTVPIYELTSSFHSKSVIETYISYNLIVRCTNNADPGKQLTVNLSELTGSSDFTIINSETNEGTFNETSGIWTLRLNDAQEAVLNLILQPNRVSSGSFTFSLVGKDKEITENYQIQAADSDGTVKSHDINLSDYPTVLANLQDGKFYTVVTYSKVHDTGVSGIHEGVKNNRIGVINENTVNSPLANFDEALKRLDSGSDEKVQVCILGTSIGEGKYAGDLTSAQMETLGFVGLLRGHDQSLYGNISEGLIGVGYHRGTEDCPWEFSSSPDWNYGTNWNGGIGGAVYYTINEGATAEITFEGTGFVLLYAKGPGYGSFEYSIDDGTPVTVDTQNAIYDFDAYTEITGLSNDVHTLKITKLNNDSKNVYILGGYETKDKNNLFIENVEKGTDTNENTDGFSSYGATIDTSDEWSVEGNRSLEITTHGSVAGEGAYAVFDTIPGEAYAVQVTIKGTVGNTYRVFVRGHTGGTTTMLLETVTLTEEVETFEYSGICPSAITQMRLMILTHTQRIEKFNADEWFAIPGTSIPDVSGIQVNCCARSGSTAYSHSKEGTMLLEIDHFQPTLTILEFSANDYGTQESLDDFETYLETLILRAKQYGDVILLPTGLQENEYSIPFIDYVEVCDRLANQHNCLFVNIFTTWGYDYEHVKNDLQYIYDTIHPNTSGHGSINTILQGAIDETIENISGGITTLGERVSSQDNIEKIVSTFIYDSSRDLKIRRYNQYTGVSTTFEDRFYGLCIKEGLDFEYDEYANLLSKPVALLDNNSFSELELDGAEESAEYVFSVDVSELPDSNTFFSGIELTINSFGTVSSGIEVQIISTSGAESKVKSTFINQTGQISLGEMADLWGLSPDDIEGETLEIHLKFKNTTLNEQTFQYSNVNLVLYYSDDEIGDAHTIICNGVHGRVYGLFMDNDKNPQGAQFNLETLKLAMMDGELPIRFNIESKELEADFNVTGETLEEAQRKLRNISNWLSNARNSIGIPILNSLIFTYDTSVEYFVILKDVIEVEKNITTLVFTIRFFVPDGVAWAVDALVTGPVGSNPGKIRVWPVIEVKTDGSGTLTVKDNETDNTITLNSAPIANTTLYIDCAARTVIDAAGNDYTTSLGLNTVWINFNGKTNYNVSVTGGVLQQVSFHPGY